MKKAKSQSGSVLIEMAVVTPVLLLMLIGTIDFGRVFYTAITVANAARAGVSYGAIDPSHAGHLAKMEEIAQTEAQNIGDVNVVAEKFCECADGSLIDCEDGTCAVGSTRVFVKVNVQKTFTTLSNFPGIPKTVVLNREAIMRAE